MQYAKAFSYPASYPNFLFLTQNEHMPLALPTYKVFTRLGQLGV